MSTKKAAFFRKSQFPKDQKPRFSKRRMREAQFGPAPKPLHIWGLLATIRDADGVVVKGDDGALLKNIPISGGLVLGDEAEAYAVAEKQQAEIAKHYPDRKITVTPVIREQVGPITAQHMQGFIFDKNTSEMTQYVLADELAKYKAKENLEINPDLAALAQKVLNEARQEVANKLKAIIEAKANAAGAGLLGPDGQPVASGQPAEPQPAALEAEQVRENLSDEQIAQSFEVPPAPAS